MITYDVPIEHPLFGQTADCPNPACAAGQVRRQARLTKAYRWAGVGLRYKNFRFDDFTGRHGTALDALIGLLEDGVINSGGTDFYGAYLFGPTGVGKTALASAVANELSAAGVDVLFCRAAQMLDQFRNSYAPDSEQKYSDLYGVAVNTTLLILDDFGAHQTTSWAVEKVLEVINARDGDLRPTIVTSNIAPDLIEGALGNDWQARRLASRIIGLCYPVEMTGGDIRKGEAA